MTTIEDVQAVDFAKWYKPPFPYFGGKGRIASIVWQHLGDVQNYVEPFFGSGAVMFARPTDAQTETINDKDHLVANFWRAVQDDPEAVAYYADNPVIEDDLTARHIWLVQEGIPQLAARMPADVEYYDAKIAGWWAWGLSCWIGSGWCTGIGPWYAEDGVIKKRARGNSEGVSRKLPFLAAAGKGVKRQNTQLAEYFQRIAARLKNVRICNGDWGRIVTRGALNYGSTVGVFLDPPYSSGTGRDMTLYREESGDVAHDVRAWCIENGDNPRYRIVLAGYRGEHDELEQIGWTAHGWHAGASYQTTASAGTGNDNNRKLETLWLSPHCLKPEGKNGKLFT